MIYGIDVKNLAFELLIPFLGMVAGNYWGRLKRKYKTVPDAVDKVIKDLGGLEVIKAAYVEGETLGSTPDSKRNYARLALRRIADALGHDKFIPDYILNTIIELIVAKIKTGELKIGK